MIWVLGTVLIVCAGVMLMEPLVVSVTKQSPARERQIYIDRVKELDGQIAKESENANALRAAKTHLKKQLLQFSETSIVKSTPPNWHLAFGLFIILLVSTLGIYNQIGGAEQVEITQKLNNQTLEELVIELEEKIGANPNTIEGQILYARTLMSLERYHEALAAYDIAHELSGEDEHISQERQQARVYITAQTINPDDRAVMIENMVAGLAARLKEMPEDPEGWTRLIRARLVMGDIEQALKDVDTAKSVFQNDEETFAKILSDSGWTEREGG